MNGAGAGRAIYPGTANPSSAPAGFSAKEEPVDNAIASELKKLNVPGLRVISSPGERMLYSRDQTEIPRFLKDTLFIPTPEIVVQPTTLIAVTVALKFASAKGLIVVPRGSGSSPFGGSVPVKGGLVMDMSRMDKIESIDTDRGVVTVEAGARWADVDHELEKSGFSLNTSPSSRFSTVGGWIATGGMGLDSFSRGHLSESVQAVEVVTPSGAIKSLSPFDKSFKAVFGSEGQLGVVTSATLLVRKRAQKSKPHLLMFSDHKSALNFARSVASGEIRPTHLMYMNAAKLSLVNRMLGKDYLTPSEAVLVNVEGEQSERAFEDFLKKTSLKEEKEYMARYLWNERYFPMKVRKFGPGLLGTEVLMPTSRLAEGVSSANSLAKKLGIDPLFEVHFLRDGWSLLLCFYTTDQGNTIGYTLDAFKSMLLTSLLLGFGGKPYSIGIWNHAFSNAEDPERVKQLAEAKSEMDPRGVMNSGKYFTLSGRLGKLVSPVFSPTLMPSVLKTFILFSPVTARMMRMGHRFAEKKLRPKNRTDLLRVADECAMCGACVSVCPAYLVVKDERVTARGKLLTVKEMARGKKLSPAHAHRIFLCTRCKACEQVCQSKLELMSVYDALESELERTYGKDAKEIEAFAKYVETMPEFDALIERGLVIGAPRHGMGGGRSGV